jgi:hypothetical protein
MVHYYRVCPYVASAAPGNPGHPRYVLPGGRGNRIDNPDHYELFYVAEQPEGAIAEAFGHHHIRTIDLLNGPPKVPGRVMALTNFEADLSITNLDDAPTLMRLGWKPSRVVTRHRKVTQSGALAIFRANGGHGIRWWIYYEPDFACLGLWDRTPLSVVNSDVSTPNHPALTGATRMLDRSLILV